MEDPFFLKIVSYDVLLLIGLLLGLLIIFYVRSIKKVRNLQEKLNEQTSTADNANAILQFLAREIQVTRTLLAREEEKESERENVSSNLKIREKLLTIEKDHLIEKGNMPSDINAIYRALLQCRYLFSDLPDKNSSRLNEEIHEKANQKINSLYKNISQQQKLITKLREYIDKTENQEAKFLANQYAEENDKESIESIQSSLNDAKEIYQQIITINNKENNNNNPDNHENLYRQTLTELKDKYTLAIKEIDKLSSANSAKRRIILDLEKQFMSMSKGINNGDHGDSNEFKKLIESLKLQLRDSEMCTAILETQTDELRTQLKESQQLTPENNAKALPIKLQDESSHLIMEGIRQLSTATSMNNLEDIITSSINELKIAGGLLITIYNQEEKALILDKKINQEIVSIIQENFNSNRDSATAPSNINWQELPQGVLLNLKNCCFFIKDISIHDDLDLVSLAKLFVVTSSTIERITLSEKTEKQAEFLISLTDKTKNSIKALDIKNKKLSGDVNQLIDRFTKDFNDFFSNLSLTKLQTEMLTDLEDEFKDRFELLFISENSMDESFVELINLLNHRLNQ